MKCIECGKKLEGTRYSRKWKLHESCLVPATNRVCKETDERWSYYPEKVRAAIAFWDENTDEMNTHTGILVEFARREVEYVTEPDEPLNEDEH